MGLNYDVFKVETLSTSAGDSADEKDRVRKELYKRLYELPPNTVEELDFSNAGVVDICFATKVVVQPLARLEAGEVPERFIILSNLNESQRKNIHTALLVAQKAILEKTPDGWDILGELLKDYREVVEVIIHKGSITARELLQERKYRDINVASTKLVAVYGHRLIAREPYREACRGGGRQFRYLSLLNNK